MINQLFSLSLHSYNLLMMDNKKATLELGTKPVGHLLWQYALPAIIAMTASSLYNIIDRIFIGQIVGPDAIAGLAITFPFMNLSGAFGAAVGVGASTAISVKLGQKDYSSAQHLLGNTVTLNVIIGIMLTIVCITFLAYWKRSNTHVFWNERLASCCIKTTNGYACNYLYRGDEHSARCGVYTMVGMGNTRSCPCNHDFANACYVLAILDIC